MQSFTNTSIGQTDGRTDRQKSYINTAVSMFTRDENLNKKENWLGTYSNII